MKKRRLIITGFFLFLFFISAFPAFSQLLNQLFLQDPTNTKDVTDVAFQVERFGIRFSINIIAVIILARFIYFKRHHNRDFVFTFILFNCINFLICFLLSNADLGIGFAFGLFAIFSIMRYRTETLPVKEMGYLFMSVAMGLMNSLAIAGWIVLVAINVFILLLALILDSSTTVTYSYDDSKQIKKNSKKIKKLLAQLSETGAEEMFYENQKKADSVQDDREENVQRIIYEKISLIKPEHRDEMIQDIRERTGLPVKSVDIIKIDLRDEQAEIQVHY